jgi:hypothetical protein
MNRDASGPVSNRVVASVGVDDPVRIPIAKRISRITDSAVVPSYVTHLCIIKLNL